MTGQKLDNSIIAASAKVYQLFLLAYPSRFRQVYGSQMLQVFQDCCRRAFGQSGARGITRFWAVTLLDFSRSVLEEHMQKEMHMSKAFLLRWSGWAFILGGIALLTILQDSDQVAIPGSLISAYLLALGLLGVRARYGDQLGGFSRNILLLGASAPLLWVLLGVIAGFMWVSGNLTDAQIGGGLWILFFAAPAFVLLGLTLFGLDALRIKPMVRFNWLPLLAGIWYPLVYYPAAGIIFTNNGVIPSSYWQSYWPTIQAMFIIQVVFLSVLGLVLIADARQELAMA